MTTQHIAELLRAGAGLTRHAHWDEALAHFNAVIDLDPQNPDGHYGRGNVLGTLQLHGEAIDSLSRAIALKPDFAAAYYNRALIRLFTGDFVDGWADYEWRWKTKGWVSKPLNVDVPPWTGQCFENTRPLVYIEQGMGDTIQFARYLPLLREKGAEPTLLSGKALLKLFRWLPGNIEVTKFVPADRRFDFVIPLMSLPHALGTTLQTVPAKTPYLEVPPAAAEIWEAKLRKTPSPRVGIAWQGNPAHHNDSNRSIALEKLAPLTEINAQLVSLQKGVSKSGRDWLSARGVLDFEDDLQDFSDTAALISRLDAVVAVDTAIAHLSGALGKPTFLLLPYVPDWRWLKDRSDSPWYPTMRLIRQQSPGDWGSALSKIHLHSK